MLQLQWVIENEFVLVTISFKTPFLFTAICEDIFSSEAYDDESMWKWHPDFNKQNEKDVIKL